MLNLEGWAASILRKDLDEIAQVNLESLHVRLLPYFDTFLLGHKDRQHILDRKHQPKVFRPQGWIVPTILVDGRVVGTWKHTQEKDRLVVTIEKFGSMSRGVTSGIREEAQNLARFLDISNVEVQIN